MARVGARDGAAVRISETDVRQWPTEAIAALKAHQLLVRARPARTVVCPGCEADCVMPVQTIPAGPRRHRAKLWPKWRTEICFHPSFDA